MDTMRKDSDLATFLLDEFHLRMNPTKPTFTDQYNGWQQWLGNSQS